MVLADDDIDLAHIRISYCVQLSLGVSTTVELHVPLDASIHCAGGE